MPDVFGTQAKIKGTFKGTTFKATLGSGGDGAGAVGAIVQNAQFNYTRQISRIWELGSLDQYYIEGHTEGQGQIGQIVGPGGLLNNMLAQLADICSAEQNSLTLSAVVNSCEGGDTDSLKLGGVIANGVSLQAQAQDHLVQSSMQLMFTSLEN